MNLTIIVAVSNDFVIGVDGELPWHLTDDLKFFKKTTTGHPVIMGRKTFESIGKPLPNRDNFVISHDTDFQPEGVTVINHIGKVFNLGDEEIFVIGGSTIYEQLFPIVNKVYLTKVDVDIDDIFATRLYGFFPNEWELVNEIGSYKNDGVDFKILEYKRKNI